jgi:site-specific DNA-cytosine methylase
MDAISMQSACNQAHIEPLDALCMRLVRWPMSFDVLLAGFPCQPFSLAGVSKKNSLNRAHGFADETQGTLFFDVARIIAHHRPSSSIVVHHRPLSSIIIQYSPSSYSIIDQNLSPPSS